MGIPTAETPPAGLNAYWLGCWRHALKVLKGQGTWAWELKPLLDEYVFALVGAEQARLEDEPARWDKHAKRASLLADQLALTGRGRRQIKLKVKEGQDGDADPFEALDAEDELARRRAKAS